MTTQTRAMDGSETLELAFSQLDEVLPPGVGRALAWLRSPAAVWVRIPIGVLCIVASFFWFLPIVGIELLPIGLLLLAQDLPWLRKPAGLFILFALAQWRRLRHWWRARHSRSP